MNRIGGSRKLCQRGSNSNVFFCFFNEGKEDSNSTKRGPFPWQADDGPTLSAGLVAL